MNFNDLLKQPLPSRETVDEPVTESATDSGVGEVIEEEAKELTPEEIAEKRKKMKKVIITTTVAISSLLVVAIALKKHAAKVNDKELEKRVDEKIKNVKALKTKVQTLNKSLMENKNNPVRVNQTNKALDEVTSELYSLRNSLELDAKKAENGANAISKKINKMSKNDKLDVNTDKFKALTDKFDALNKIKRDIKTITESGEGLGEDYEWANKELYKESVLGLGEDFTESVLDSILEENAEVVDMLTESVFAEASNSDDELTAEEKAEKKKLKRNIAITIATVGGIAALAGGVLALAKKNGNKDVEAKIKECQSKIKNKENKLKALRGVISDRALSGSDITNVKRQFDTVSEECDTLKETITSLRTSVSKKSDKSNIKTESTELLEVEITESGFGEDFDIFTSLIVESMLVEECDSAHGTASPVTMEDDDDDTDPDEDDDFDPDDLTDEELAELDSELTDENLDALLGDEPEATLDPEEERLADDMMGTAATTELIRSEMNAEERTKFIESKEDVEFAIREALMLESDVMDIATELGIDYMTESKNYNKKMVIRLDKESKMKQLYALAINVSAAAHNDPDYAKYKKVMRMRKILRAKMKKRYHSEALKRMRVYYKRLVSSKSNILSTLGKKLSGKGE